jgi:hypothetical protein
MAKQIIINKNKKAFGRIKNNIKIVDIIASKMEIIKVSFIPVFLFGINKSIDYKNIIFNNQFIYNLKI